MNARTGSDFQQVPTCGRHRQVALERPLDLFDFIIMVRVFAVVFLIEFPRNRGVMRPLLVELLVCFKRAHWCLKLDSSRWHANKRRDIAGTCFPRKTAWQTLSLHGLLSV